jgi:predicted nucleic acid-binding protein
LAIILDTGLFYAYFDKKDSHHFDSAALLYHCLEGRFGTAFVSDYVALETTLLVQRKLGDDVCLSFLDFLRDSGLRTIAVGEEYYGATLEITRRNFPRLSMCDSATLVLIDSLGIQWLATYDESSFEGRVHDILGRNYFNSLGREERAKINRQIQGKKR